MSTLAQSNGYIDKAHTVNKTIVPNETSGELLVFEEGLSFWGGVNADTGVVQDTHHPQYGACVAGKVVLMPTSRGSCSGSGVLLELALNGHAPAALVFHEAEDTLTLGALIATHMYDCPVGVVQLCKDSYDSLLMQQHVTIASDRLTGGSLTIELSPLDTNTLALSATDRAMLDGEQGEAALLAMHIIQIMGTAQQAKQLIDVTRVHIDGCIYASPANLTFASTMQKMGAKVKVPTTMNAISVELDKWQSQGVPLAFGTSASQLALAYQSMGSQPTFTCAPYQAKHQRPAVGENIGWSESNAVIFANSVLGAHTVKHPDFFDLFVAITGRAPRSGVYLDENRQAKLRLLIDLPENHDDALWPLLGWIAGNLAPDQIPILEGLDNIKMSEDNLKALCAAFGTTSAAPMLHIKGVTPEGHKDAQPGSASIGITRDMLASAWGTLNTGPEEVDLVALGSPHFSLAESREFAELMQGQQCATSVHCIITLSRETFIKAHTEGVITTLEKAGVKVLRDLCWCSISEPVFPAEARHLVTNSGKYAHYAPGLCNRTVRFASLEDCALAAREARLDKRLPDWLE